MTRYTNSWAMLPSGLSPTRRGRRAARRALREDVGDGGLELEAALQPASFLRVSHRTPSAGGAPVASQPLKQDRAFRSHIHQVLVTRRRDTPSVVVGTSFEIGPGHARRPAIFLRRLPGAADDQGRRHGRDPKQTLWRDALSPVSAAWLRAGLPRGQQGSDAVGYGPQRGRAVHGVAATEGSRTPIHATSTSGRARTRAAQLIPSANRASAAPGSSSGRRHRSAPLTPASRLSISYLFR